MRSVQFLLSVAVVMTVAVISSAADDPAPDSYWVYFGTYTGGKAGSKGIHRSKLDARTGKLTAPELAAELVSPSFLAVHPKNSHLYAVAEVTSTGKKKGGGVYAFAIDSKSGTLTRLNDDVSGGAGPCHIAVNPQGTYIGVANYGGGSTAFFALGRDGKIEKRASFIQHKGSGPNKGRQEGPHAHCVQFIPDGTTAFTCDLGIDKAKCFVMDGIKGGYQETPAGDITLPPGSGPRHIAIDKTAGHAYICGELDSTVNVVKLDIVTGKNEVIQTLSTLPKPVKGNSTAEVVIHPSGKFVYVSNRGHNSIAVFRVGTDRKLTAAGHITGDIRIPRNFNVDPTGKWMLIASQNGNKVGVWEIDTATGMGKETGNTVSVGMPVCVKFVPAAK